MRWLLRYTKWTLVRLGYLVRPYDMAADRRRWFWRPRTSCHWEIDRNARAYGWEIGRGQRLGEMVRASEDNPFLSPDWRSTL